MRILLVEDERPLAEVVRRGLSREGFVVDVVHDGEDGVWAATESGYDAIVLDIMLPKLDGYQVIARLRDAGVWTPTLMLTAVDGEHDQAEAFNLGADDYLTKPFSFIVLVARLHALIRRGAPERPVVLTAGSLSLDPVRRRVQRGTVEIALTAKEFALLTFLMKHAGAVITKTAILEAVWDPAYDGDVNIVEVYVGANGPTTIDRITLTMTLSSHRRDQRQPRHRIMPTSARQPPCPARDPPTSSA